MRPRYFAPIALGALLLAGCGGSSSSSSNGDFNAVSSSDRAGQTLSIYGFGKGDDVAQNRLVLAKRAIAPAKLHNPDGAYDPQRFLTQLASGNVPDLIYVDRQQIGTLAAKGTLQPLEGCVDAQQVKLSQYRQAALDEASYQGKLYALPEFTNQRALIVNELPRAGGVGRAGTRGGGFPAVDARPDGGRDGAGVSGGAGRAAVCVVSPDGINPDHLAPVLRCGWRPTARAGRAAWGTTRRCRRGRGRCPPPRATSS